MRAQGISYSTGSFTRAQRGREPFDPDLVRREMRIIHDDLHCTAVRVIGGDPDRLQVAASLAADAGLEVWYCPFPIDMDSGEMLALFGECAIDAERLRERGVETVFVTGAELTLLAKGFLPGETLGDRIALLSDRERLRDSLQKVPERLGDFLAGAVRAVKERFHGKITYASLPTERIDWSPFDFVGVDAYKSAEVAERYRDAIRALVAQGKPVAITEFGCATFRGAADLGARGIFIVDREAEGGVRLRGEYTRDEQEQAAYARELLDLFAGEGVDSAFWCVFADYTLPHRADPREDLDMGSYGVVKVLEDRLGTAYPQMPWEPKAAFEALAERYERFS